MLRHYIYFCLAQKTSSQMINFFFVNGEVSAVDECDSSRYEISFLCVLHLRGHRIVCSLLFWNLFSTVWTMSFCFPGPCCLRLSPHQIIWLDSLATEPRSALLSLSLSRQNKQPRMETWADWRERSDALTGLYSDWAAPVTDNQLLFSPWKSRHSKAGMCQRNTIKIKNLSKINT